MNYRRVDKNRLTNVSNSHQMSKLMRARESTRVPLINSHRLSTILINSLQSLSTLFYSHRHSSILFNSHKLFSTLINSHQILCSFNPGFSCGTLSRRKILNLPKYMDFLAFRKHVEQNYRNDVTQRQDKITKYSLMTAPVRCFSVPCYKQQILTEHNF